MKLIDLIITAEIEKPNFGDDCNSCGWCCLTEVCIVGKDHGGGEMLPCKFLTMGKKCALVVVQKVKPSDIGGSTGCCAKTQKEVITGVML